MFHLKFRRLVISCFVATSLFGVVMLESACCAVSTAKTIPHVPQPPVVGDYQPGDGVRITEGEYKDSYGTVINVDPDRGDYCLDIRLQQDHNDYWFSPEQVQRIDMS